MIGVDPHESNSSEVSSPVWRLRVQNLTKKGSGSLALRGQILYIKKLDEERTGRLLPANSPSDLIVWLKHRSALPIHSSASLCFPFSSQPLPAVCFRARLAQFFRLSR